MVRKLSCACFLIMIMYIGILNVSIAQGESLGPGGGDVRVGKNIIRNPGFEEETEGMPEEWETNGISDGVACRVTGNSALNGTKCLEISSSVLTEAYVVQQVDAEPDKYYRVMLNVLPMKIEQQFGSPHLVIYYGSSPEDSTKKYFSAEIKDTDGFWASIGFYIKTLNTNEPINIALSLGGGQGYKNSGTVYFDDISMQPVENPHNIKEFEKVAFTATGIMPPGVASPLFSEAGGGNTVLIVVITVILLAVVSAVYRLYGMNIDTKTSFYQDNIRKGSE